MQNDRFAIAGHKIKRLVFNEKEDGQVSYRLKMANKLKELLSIGLPPSDETMSHIVSLITMPTSDETTPDS